MTSKYATEDNECGCLKPLQCNFHSLSQPRCSVKWDRAFETKQPRKDQQQDSLKLVDLNNVGNENQSADW